MLAHATTTAPEATFSTMIDAPPAPLAEPLPLATAVAYPVAATPPTAPNAHPQPRAHEHSLLGGGALEIAIKAEAMHTTKATEDSQECSQVPMSFDECFELDMLRFRFGMTA